MLKNNTTNNFTSEKLITKQGKGLAQWERLVKRREVPEAPRCCRGRLSKAIKKAPVVDYNIPEDYNVPEDYDVPEDHGVPGDYNVPENYDIPDDSGIPEDSDNPEDHGVPEEDVQDFSKRGRRLEDIEGHSGAIIWHAAHPNKRKITEECTKAYDNKESEDCD